MNQKLVLSGYRTKLDKEFGHFLQINDSMDHAYGMLSIHQIFKFDSPPPPSRKYATYSEVVFSLNSKLCYFRAYRNMQPTAKLISL